MAISPDYDVLVIFHPHPNADLVPATLSPKKKSEQIGP